MIITVITKYQGRDAESFVTVVRGTINAEQRDAWRKMHECDEYYKGHPADVNNMFFRTMDLGHSQKPTLSMPNVDGEDEADDFAG